MRGVDTLGLRHFWRPDIVTAVSERHWKPLKLSGSDLHALNSVLSIAWNEGGEERGGEEEGVEGREGKEGVGKGGEGWGRV